MRGSSATMGFCTWQVGLAFENGTARALAVQRRRQGWQLRQWWQQNLPEAARDGVGGSPPAGLERQLSAWRRQLPGRISLRVCLPAAELMHRRMAAPDNRLSEPEREWYIAAHARRHFPIGHEKLLLDYRRDPQAPDTLLVTAARQAAVEQWLNCLERAGLVPDVLDIAPCALRCMAGAAGLAPDRLLVHASRAGWQWASPLAHPLEFGFITVCEAPSLPAARSLIDQRYRRGHGAGEPVYLSSDILRAPQADALPWSPFSALWQAHPPMPAWPAAFTIAGGLAVRPGDA
ncbi:pilus assembly protein PilM [Acerihabitans arboris]|uniref:Pilus assembly protein HofM n=1 Tax=Acerihabitans arboris TaxID=2691583 RepID=A0A845STW5_9GAMM|nr:pilus assembly protein PilM [Acerihabitans arboris]NDL64475.1 pilus assembly protein HofM [Acerihabitans arboris]